MKLYFGPCENDSSEKTQKGRRGQRAPATATYNCSSCEDDGQAEGWNDDARREEDGELFAGVTGRVRVVNHPPRDAVRDRSEDVEEEEEQRPVFAADGEKRGRN